MCPGVPGKPRKICGPLAVTPRRVQELPPPQGRNLARQLLGSSRVSSSTDESWTLPIRIGMWCVFVIAIVMVMVVVLMH
ncbi:hypothetical protein BH11MYX3_BH11MYX3_35050 [soil metagenome]